MFGKRKLPELRLRLPLPAGAGGAEEREREREFLREGPLFSASLLSRLLVLRMRMLLPRRRGEGSCRLVLRLTGAEPE